MTYTSLGKVQGFQTSFYENSINFCFSLCSPSGKKFRSRTELAYWVDQNNVTDIKPEDIDFSVQGTDKKRGTPGRRNSLKTPTPKAKKISPKKKSPKKSLTKCKESSSKLVIKMGFNYGKKKKKPGRDKAKAKREDVEDPEDDEPLSELTAVKAKPIEPECNNNNDSDAKTEDIPTTEQPQLTGSPITTPWKHKRTNSEPLSEKKWNSPTKKMKRMSVECLVHESVEGSPSANEGKLSLRTN
jgi:hypothetical protein